MESNISAKSAQKLNVVSCEKVNIDVIKSFPLHKAAGVLFARKENNICNKIKTVVISNNKLSVKRGMC